MSSDTASLWTRLSGLIIFGWAVAAIRLVLEFVAPDYSLWFGVYWMMPLGLLYYGLSGVLDDLPWKRIAVGMVFVGALVWFLPNAFSYSLAPFLGWEHGRFGEDRFPTIVGKDTPVNIILNGIAVSVGTFLAGTVWCLAFGTLFTWLPGHFRRKKLQTA